MVTRRNNRRKAKGKMYVYSDLTVYYRADNGKYVNISETEIGDSSRFYTIEKAEAKIVIAIFSFFYKKQKVLICEAEIDELVKIAGVKFSHSPSLFKGSEDLLAVLCARKMIGYQYGTLKPVGENVYSFCRKRRKDENGNNFVALTKRVREVAIKNAETP